MSLTDLPSPKGLLNRMVGAVLNGSPDARMRQADEWMAQGQTAKAARLYAELGEAGRADAAYALARLYESGKGVVANMADAAYWFRKAADQNHAPSQARLATLLMVAPQAPAEESPPEEDQLGVLFPHRRSLSADPPEARRLAITAAEAGDLDGLSLAGYMLASGFGGPADPVRAAEYYLPAAEAGHTEACLGLGTLMAGGFLGEVDHDSARVWFEVAADANNATALMSLGRQMQEGWGGPKDPEGAFVCYARAADLGHTAASRLLGLAYLNGNGVTKDVGRAEEWLRKAAQKGDIPAMAALGALVKERNTQEGLRFLSAAAERGDRQSQRLLAQMYRTGQGVPKDPKQALYWLERAARGGDTEAQFELGVAYAVGQDVPRDFGLANSWSEAAAKGGHSVAKVNLGRFKMQGVGGTRDPADALLWLKAALDDGEVAAIVALGELYAFWMDPPDLTRARLLFEKGISLGDARSRELLDRVNQQARVA